MKHKEFHLAVKCVAGIKVAICTGCGGTGCSMYDQYECAGCLDGHGCLDENRTPCPTCAPWRELEKLCWHKGSVYMNFTGLNESLWKCSKCGIKVTTTMGWEADNSDWDNPTYTIQSIRAMLESLGEWEGFIWWHDGQVYTRGWENHHYSVIVNSCADILTSDPLMLNAAIEYLKGVE